jgi:Protein of unknown function (DUF1517)
MSAWTDRFNSLTGKKRLVVSRIFVALTGNESTTLLGVLNRAAQVAIDSDGDLDIMGESLVEICESLLQRETSWESSHNEGDVFWSEEEASQYLNELFTDSSRRYFSEMDETPDDDQSLSIPMTQNVVVMMTLAIEGEVPDLEADLSNIQALRQALSQICNLQSQRRLRAIQVNFSPDQMGVVLTSDHLMQQFPELIPL